MNNIYVCYTVYHLYLTLVTCKKNEKNIVILTDFTKGLIGYRNKLLELDYITNVYFIENDKFESSYKNCSLPNKLKRFFNYRKSLLCLYDHEYPILNDLPKNARVHLFVDVAYLSRYLMYKYKGIRLLDDGEGNYFPIIKNIKYYIRHYLFLMPVGRGRHKSIKEIWFRYPEKLQREQLKGIKHKLNKLNLSSEENKLSVKDKELILNFFGLDVVSCTKKSLLLMTQPFSEDLFITEDEKINIYREIVEKYKLLDFNVFIKPHPREETDYKYFFNELFVLDKNVPTECYNLDSNITFSIGVAIQSTALTNASFVAEKLMLGYDNYPSLKAGKENVDAVRVS